MSDERGMNPVKMAYQKFKSFEHTSKNFHFIHRLQTAILPFEPRGSTMNTTGWGGSEKWRIFTIFVSKSGFLEKKFQLIQPTESWDSLVIWAAENGQIIEKLFGVFGREAIMSNSHMHSTPPPHTLFT